MRWCQYLWLEAHGADHIHPDDFNAFRAFSAYGKVFEFREADAVWVTIRYGTNVFRVKPDLIREVFPAERIFSVGESVVLSETGIAAEIMDVGWHSKDAQPIYNLRVNGKKKSKRYFPRDLSEV